MSRETIKMLIELADTIEEVNKLLSNEYPEFNTYQLKLAFLTGMFDFEIIGRNKKDIKVDYYCVLNAIINQKWR